MRLSVGFSYTSFSAAFIFQLRQMAEQINRLSDTLSYIQSVNTGSENSINRFISVSVSLNYPLIAAGAVGTLNVTVAGALVGDYVTVCPPSTLEAGLVYSGFVSAADTVTIRLFNGSGAGVDPAVASWKVLVTGLG